jgi:hypothetical protein
MAANSNFAGFNGHKQGNNDVASIEGGTSFSITTNNRGFIGNYNLEIGKKYYWEVRAKSFGGSSDQLFIGVCKDTIDLSANRGGGEVSGGGYGFENYNNNVYLSSSSSAGSGPGQFRSPPNNIRVKVDRVNHTISWALDAGSFSSTYTIPSTGRLYPWLGSGGGTLTAESRANFGQDSTFSGDLTAQTNTDENGFGEFYYSVPSGFLACCSGNKSVSADIDPNLTDDNYPGKNFNVVEYTGNATTGQSITGMGFKPDLLIGKMTSSSQNWQVFDSQRLNSRSPTPTPNFLKTDSSNAEVDDQSAGNTNPIISSFDSDGFTLGTSGSGPNDSGRTYNAFGFKANGGTTSSNSNGTITSTVQANTKAGFSIITYTGTGSNATIGHGLSQKPDMFWVKDRARDESWNVYHTDLGATKYLVLNTTAGSATNSNRWNDTEPTSTTIGLGTNDNTNGSSNYVCYAWHSVAGYSSFGSYDGTGSQNGRYIDLGFRPKWLIIKKSSEASTTYGWANFNTEHQKFNKAEFSGGWLDTSAAFSGNYDVQILGNGFKHRNNNTNLDGSGKTYIYAAWGDVPAKYSNGF